MIQTKIYQVKGMHCASCSVIIEKTFRKVEGVREAQVNYGTETARLIFDDEKTHPDELTLLIKPLGYELVVENEKPTRVTKVENVHHVARGGEKYTQLRSMQRDKTEELEILKKDLIVSIPLAFFSVIVMGWDIFGKFGFITPMSVVWYEFFHHILPLMATYMLFVVGKPYLLGMYRFARYGKANMDTLIGIGTFTAFFYSVIVTAFEESLARFIDVEQNYYDVAIVVIAFITLGKYLELRSKIKTSDAIEQLINLSAKTAHILQNGHEREIGIEEVQLEDILIVKPGGKIPVDGVVVNGSSFVDASLISGEPIPVEKNKDDKVIAGTINTMGTFNFRATKIGSDTLLARIVRMVQEAQGSKAPIQALADKISSVFVPTVLMIAIVALVFWVIIGTPLLGFSEALSFGLVSFVGILVIACPCALGLATPMAIIVGVGKGAREGILIKDAKTLEKLGGANVVVFDKTGTITKGKPEFIRMYNYGTHSDSDLISVLASLEQKSEHPIAHAIVAHAKEEGIPITEVENFVAIGGKGIKGNIDGTQYFVGSPMFIESLGLAVDMATVQDEMKEGKTPILIATEKKLLGVVLVADKIKPEAHLAITHLHGLGVETVMLTGDQENTANFVAREVGIHRVVAELSPEGKLAYIQSLQKEGKVVVMAGDGVNDAPALAQSDVGIAMSSGTDVAIETAGITLLHGDIVKIVKAITLSRMTMRTVKQNLFFAFIYNIIGIPLAGGLFYPIFGVMLSPVFAGIAMAFSSVSVVGNALRLKVKKL